MAAMVLVAVVLFVVHGASIPRIGASSSVPDSQLKRLFRAHKTGVLSLAEDELRPGWIRSYQLIPTRESVDVVKKLLEEKPLNSPYCIPENRTAEGSPSVLMTLIWKGATASKQYLVQFLLEYAIFKSFLYGSLSQDESEALRSIFSETSMRPTYLAHLIKLVNDLTNAGNSCDLFVALANNMNDVELRGILHKLDAYYPGAIGKLAMRYTKGGSGNAVNVPHCLLPFLGHEVKYELLATHTSTDELIQHLSPADWLGIYALSKLSKLPSESIRDLCVRSNYNCQVCEEKSEIPADASCLDPASLPNDVWIKVLLSCDNILSQIWAVPRVCRLWRELHPTLLSRSLAVQEVFMEQSNETFGAIVMNAYLGYPWAYFINSRQAFLEYYLICLKSGQIPNAYRDNQTGRCWTPVVEEITQRGFRIPQALYLDSYVSCCEANKGPLKFPQLPGMSDQEYVTLIRRIVDQHKIIPAIPMWVLKKDCGRFVQMMKDDSELIAILFRDSPWCYDLLVPHLFLTKSCISPAVDRVLREASASYCALMDESNSIEERCGILFKGFVRGLDAHVSARMIIDLCLANGPKCDPEMLKRWGDEFWRCYSNQSCKDRARDLRFRRSMNRILSFSVVKLLCEHCQDYSEEEFSILERFLEHCEIFDEDTKSYAFKKCVAESLKNAKVAIELI